MMISFMFLFSFNYRRYFTFKKREFLGNREIGKQGKQRKKARGWERNKKYELDMKILKKINIKKTNLYRNQRQSSAANVRHPLKI